MSEKLHNNEKIYFKRIQSRLKRNYEIIKSYQKIKEAYYTVINSAEEKPTEEQMQEIVEKLKFESKENISPSSGLSTVSQSLIKPEENLSFEIQPEEIQPEQVEPVELKGEIQLIAESEKLEIVGSTLQKGGLKLHKQEIQTIAKSIPANCTSRGEMITHVLGLIKTYLAEEEKYIQSQFQSLYQTIDESDRNVVGLLNNFSSAMEESTNDYKSCGEELTTAFAEISARFKQ
jgi:hypothetical protein